MSRSYRHTPMCGNCICDSEKRCKQFWHRKLRTTSRRKLKFCAARSTRFDEILLPHDHEYSDPWDFGKDGKRRFDPHEWPESMRK